jgi:ribosomal peptide maturation radical SAM protein 1
MPFGAVRTAIGPSLLEGHLDRLGVESRILYLNMRFARLLGGSEYEEVAERMPTQSLAGDWVFAPQLFGDRPDADAAWRDAFRERFARYLDPGPALELLDRARALADPFLDACMNDVPWQEYDLVGFTSTFFQHVASLALARRIKERFPDTVVGFGGGNCEDVMGLQLHQSFPFVDFVCSGEADVSLPHVVQAVIQGQDLGEIPGVVSRRDGLSQAKTLTPERVRDMDTLPHPRYDDFFAQRAEIWPQANEQAGVLMESSRGCWWGEKHHCTFCGLNGLAMTFRSKSADRVLAELDALTDRYHPSFVAMVDNILDMRYFRDLLPALRDRGLALDLFYETKANLTKDQLLTLRAAGVHTIQPGIESLSTDVLKIMRKGTTAVQNLQLLKWCKEIGIKAYWNFIFGFPGEDPDEYGKMAALIPAIPHLQPPVSVGPIRLDRFSPNLVSASELGFSNVRPDRSYRHVYALPDGDLDHLAYYFEHDYEDAREPESYAGQLRDAVRCWHEQSAGRGLLYADHGDTLAVWDFRPGADQTVTILEGSDRELYLYCDQYRSRQNVHAFLSARGVDGSCADATLEQLVTSRLVVELDQRYLSLAVRMASTADLDAISEPTAEYAVF